MGGNIYLKINEEGTQMQLCVCNVFGYDSIHHALDMTVLWFIKPPLLE